MKDGDGKQKENLDDAGSQKKREEGVEEPFGTEENEDHLYDDWDQLASDPEEASRLSRAIEGILPDVVRRSVGGLVSEEGIRTLVKDRGLPREAVGFIMGQVDATKREVVRMVSKEVRMFLENVDLGGELTKILTSISFEIRTEVRFIPNDAAVKPNVRNRVRVRGRKSDDPEEGGDDDEQVGEEEEAEERKENQKGDPTPRRRRWSLRGRGNNNDDSQASEGSDD